MSDNLTRKEVWPVNVRVTGELIEQSVVFLKYHDTIDASLIAEDAGDIADTGTYVVALFDAIVVNGTDNPISGVLVSRFPDGADDATYLAICEALTGSPLPTAFGEKYVGYDLEQLRDDLNDAAGTDPV